MPSQVALLWNKVRDKVFSEDHHFAFLRFLIAPVCLFLLATVTQLSSSPFHAVVLLLVTGSFLIIGRFFIKGALGSIFAIGAFSLFAFFTREELFTSWNVLWIVSLVMSLWLFADGLKSFAGVSETLEKNLKDAKESSALWQTRFETLQQKFREEKEKVESLSGEMQLVEEKHLERVEGLKELIDVTTSESAKQIYRVNTLLKEREETAQRMRLLEQEVEALKQAHTDQEESYSNKDFVKRLKELNELRQQNYQLEILIGEMAKKQKMYEKAHRERAFRSSHRTPNKDQITLQDLAKVISKVSKN